MFKTIITPQNISRPVPSRPRPGGVYTQRSVEFARIIRTAR